MKLFHISENPDIKIFKPRLSKPIWNCEQFVWAIIENKLHNYLLPRNCPRICIGRNEVKKIPFELVKLPKGAYKAYVFIPNDWLRRVKACVLYQYEFKPKNFFEIDSIASYYVSRKTETPIGVNQIRNCPAAIENLNVGLQAMNSKELKQLKQITVNQMTNFSIIRWNNML